MCPRFRAINSEDILVASASCRLACPERSRRARASCLRRRGQDVPTIAAGTAALRLQSSVSLPETRPFVWRGYLVRWGDRAENENRFTCTPFKKKLMRILVIEDDAALS